jgi:hypothetical protein
VGLGDGVLQEDGHQTVQGGKASQKVLGGADRSDEIAYLTIIPLGQDHGEIVEVVQLVEAVDLHVHKDPMGIHGAVCGGDVGDSLKHLSGHDEDPHISRFKLGAAVEGYTVGASEALHHREHGNGFFLGRCADPYTVKASRDMLTYAQGTDIHDSLLGVSFLLSYMNLGDLSIGIS